MYTQTLHRVAMVGVAGTLLALNLACNGGGGGGDDSFISDAEVEQIATTAGVAQDPTKGTVAVETSQVTSSSVQTSAVVNGLTVLLFADGNPLELEEGTDEDGTIIVFFNVPPGDVQLKITREGIEVFARDITVSEGQTVQIRASAEPTSEAQALAARAMTNLLSATPDVETAAADFDAALEKDGDNDLALLGSALTRMALLPATSSDIAEILDTLGFQFNPNALLPQIDENPFTEVAEAAAVGGSDVQDVIDSAILPAIDTALEKLAKIGSDFVQGAGGIEVDYSDVLAARASLTTTKGLLQTANAYDASVPDVSALGDLEAVLATEAAPVGTVRDTARLTAAKNTLVSAIDLSVSFIDALQDESDSQADDLIQKSDDAQEVAAMKQGLQDTKASLQGSSTSIRTPNEAFDGACTDTATIDLAAFFAGGLDDLRDADTDPTAGGLFPGSTDGNPVTTTDCPTPNATNGESVYGARCLSCHGANGGGTQSAPFIAFSSPGELRAAMGTGSMASLSLTLEEAADVAAFLGF
jgi:hypothetical protein